MNIYSLGLLGLPGAGKSTVVPLLCTPDTGLTARSTTQFHRPGTRMTTYIAQLFTEQERDVALACQVEALARRAMLQRSASASDCIDEPVEAVHAHTTAMHAVGMLAKDHHDSWMLLYDVLRDTLPHAVHLAVLTCGREELWRRIMERSRQRDRSVSDEYLDAFAVAIQRVAEDSKSVVLTIDTTVLAPPDVASAILREMRRL